MHFELCFVFCRAVIYRHTPKFRFFDWFYCMPPIQNCIVIYTIPSIVEDIHTWPPPYALIFNFARKEA
jgi:hypothetical protein